MQSVGSIATYAYVASKDLVSEKQEIEWKNLTKWYKKWLVLMMLQKKT